MQKAKRLIAIEKIITGENIASQDELLKKLRFKGINCTQATLSRDLRQLGVGRVAGGTGGYRYMLPGSTANAVLNRPELNIIPVIRDVIEANHLIVIRTLPGNASNTALVIDGAGRYEIAGTIAGDDTILVIPRDGITMQQVHTCIEMILPGVHEHIKKQAQEIFNIRKE